MSKTTSQVMDASAILAYLLEEPGHKQIGTLLLSGRCMISTVNLAEVLGKLIDRGLLSHQARTIVSTLHLIPIPFTIEAARLAADLRLPTKSIGASLADRACMALAKLENATAHTTDSLWTTLHIPNLKIHLHR